MLFDTHVHLNDPIYKQDLEQVITNALNDNIKIMLVVGYDLETSKKAIELANQYPFIYASVGIHPSESLTQYDKDLKELETLITSKVIAIGEIGLDYHYDNIDKNKQKDLFIKQIKLASKYKLPIIIHSRDACLDTYNILKEYQKEYQKGIMHCYSYSLEMAHEFINLGFKLGIGGVLTYKNAKELKRVIENTSLEHLVLETDAPYLTPTPFRGKRNEPRYVKYVAQELAKIKNISISEIEQITTKNALELLGVHYEN